MVKALRNPTVRRARSRKSKTQDVSVEKRELFLSPNRDEIGLEDCVGTLAHTPSPKNGPPNLFSGSPKNRRTIRRFFRVVDLTSVTESCENFEKVDAENVLDVRETNGQTKPPVECEIITDKPCRVTEKEIIVEGKFIAPAVSHSVGRRKQRKNGVKSIEVDTNHKLTEFFPVRRSVRKTKKIVQEEKQRSLEEAVRLKIQDGLDVCEFEGKGRGVIATRLFRRGDYVVEYRGELIDMTEARRRELIYSRDRNAGCYMYYFRHRDDQYCVDATPESDHFGRLVNHSRNGNLVTKTLVVSGVPHLVLIAKEDIKPGEELTYDYGDRSKESLKHHPWLAL